MDKIYIVRYSRGSYDDYHEIDLFGTLSKDVAEIYIKKFNRILNAYKDFYKQFEYEQYPGMTWIKKEYVNDYFDRWIFLSETNKAFIDELNIRK